MSARGGSSLALRRVRAEKIGPLDRAHPDGPVFVLTAILLSAAVRFSALLLPLLAGLRPWPGVDEKLTHWLTSSAAMPPTVPRLSHGCAASSVMPNVYTPKSRGDWPQRCPWR